MKAEPGERKRDDEQDDEHPQGLRKHHAVRASAMTLAQDRHFRRASGNAGEKRSGRVESGAAHEEPAARISEQDREHGRRNNRYQCAATSPAIAGVKSRPSAHAMTSCPAALPPLGAATSAPRNFPSAIASSGPIIHGSGARSALNKTPPMPQIAGALKTG